MIASIGSNYLMGLLIQKYSRTPKARLLTALAVTINLGLLGWFKYANFLADNLNRLLPALSLPPLELTPVHLPIGISFFTFQALSYIIDLYRGEVSAQKNPVKMGLYISLFPQLIAGPIVRYHDVARQLEKRTVTLDLFSSGVRRFIIGLGKKMLIANPMGEITDEIMRIPAGELSPLLAWLGIVCYTLQIFFDFSGYSDMAIGLGRMFGFRFLENFNYPYISRSIREFWRRWHISLSSWFRDYLYIPMGGGRVGRVRVYFNLWTVFLLCGLWHGASWNFVIWGMLHGFFIVLERVGWGKLLARLGSPVQHAYTLLVVMVAWVFFRIESFPDALSYLASMAGLSQGDAARYHPALFLNTEKTLALIFGLLFSIPVQSIAGNFLQRFSFSGDKRAKIAWAWISAVMTTLVFFISVLYVASGTYNPFIYFRF